MPKVGVRDLEKEHQWRQILEKCAASGKSRKQFCADEGLKLDAFTYWKTTITARDNAVSSAKSRAEKMPKETFVPVNVATGSREHVKAKSQVVAQIVFAGGSIHVFDTSDISFLKRLLLALKETTH